MDIDTMHKAAVAAASIVGGCKYWVLGTTAKDVSLAEKAEAARLLGTWLQHLRAACLYPDPAPLRRSFHPLGERLWLTLHGAAITAGTQPAFADLPRALRLALEAYAQVMNALDWINIADPLPPAPAAPRPRDVPDRFTREDDEFVSFAPRAPRADADATES